MLVVSISNISEFAYFRIIFKHYLPMFMLQFLIKEFYKNFNFKTSKDNFEKYFKLDDLLFMLNSPQQYSKDLKEHCNFYLRKRMGFGNKNKIKNLIHCKNILPAFLNKRR
jgi:hypothetical protein